MYTVAEFVTGRTRWAVYAPDGQLLCVCLYRKGAEKVADHLNALTH